MFKATTSLGIPIANDPLSDFRKFLFVIWKHLNLPDPTPVQYDIACNLQHGDKRMIIEAFRGVGKSWLTSAYVVWLLYMNPQLNILVVSASKSRSDDFTTFTLRLINEIEVLAHLRPKPDQRQSKISFDVAPAAASHAPSVKSVGISGQLAGSRADVIVADDIEVPNNSMTQGMRDKLSEAVKEFDAILEPVMNQHRLVMDKKVIQKDFDSCQHLPPEQALRYQLMYQLTRLTADSGALTNDDRLDALAMACQYWVDAMAQDVEQRMCVRKEELMAAELNRLREQASMGFAIITGHQSEKTSTTTNLRW